MTRRITTCLSLIVLLSSAIMMTMPTAATAATYWCMGKRATIVGTNGANTLSGTRRADVIVGRGGNDTIYGKGRADRICGGGGSDYLDGGRTSDRIAGQTGDDSLVGRGGGDLLSGDDGIDVLLGMNGGDRYLGGRDVDVAAFLVAQESVVVDLSAGAAEGEGDDTLRGIEAVAGSSHDDWLYGDEGQNFFWGLTGGDYLYGAGGADFVSFDFSELGVQASLAGESATGEGSDELVSIENLFGSDHDDTLVGTTGPNFLIGGEGQDTIDGRGGQDLCDGETHLDCPSPPAAPTVEPPSGDDPPPPPPDGARSSAVTTTPRHVERDRAFGRIGESGLLELARTAEALASAAPATGFLDCVYNVAHPPTLSFPGHVSWQPWWLFWSPATGYYWVSGGWQTDWQWTGTMSHQQAPGQGIYQGWVAAYYQLYNHSSGIMGGYWVQSGLKDPFGQIFWQDSNWCGAR